MSTKVNSRRHIRSGLVAISALATLLVAGAAFADSDFPRGHSRTSDHRTPTHVCSDRAIDIEPRMAAHTFNTTAAGEVSCGAVTGQHCTGYVSPDPVCLHVRYPTTVEIEVTWSNADTVLALTGPSGSFTDDDGGRGTNSRLVQYLTPGDYLLYPGTYHYGVRGDASISIADATRETRPEYRDRGRGEDRGRGHGRGRGHSAARAPAPDPALMCPAGSQVMVLSRRQAVAWASGTAAGEMDSSDRVGRFAAGWLPYSPQICVVVEQAGNYSFEVTSSPGDTVMAVAPVNVAGSVLFDDDGGSGWMSRIQGHLDAGVYLVYVGTFGWGDRDPFQLVATRS